jgi:microcin C transport system permease protein
LQAKQNLQAPWLGFTAFFTFAIMLSLLVFIFEACATPSTRERPSA